jgi:hypothetical protein
VTITVRRGVDGYAVISGMQITRVPQNLTASIAVSPLAKFPGVTNLLVIAPDCSSQAQVVLDASGSTNAVSQLLSFHWFEGQKLLATGMKATVQLPVGSHEITLVVSDGTETAISTQRVEVISLAEAVACIITLVEDSSLPYRDQRHLTTTLNRALDSFSRCNLNAAKNHLKDFQKQVSLEVVPMDSRFADQLITSLWVISNTSRD